MPKRLLSVDDDKDILDIIQGVAAELGFEVDAVNHSNMFMKAYARIKPDVITLDMIMPDMDGIELIRWLGDVGCQARVILVSGASLAYSKMATRLAEDGAHLDIHTLRKPFRLAELRAMLTGGLPQGGLQSGELVQML
jgi:DNA-binding response OmpR family regulator